jgi:type I restriction enzyme, S subunit
MNDLRTQWTTWNNVQLIESGILEIGDGYRAKNSEMGLVGLPFARAGNIDNGFHFEDADLLDEMNVPKAGSKISRPGDVVFTSKGTVGRFAFVRPETKRFVYSPQLCYWRIKDSSIIDPRFLFYWMHGRDFTTQVHQVKGLTDMADYVSLGDQRRMKITAPPLPAQRKIAAILSAYDDLIENNTRRIAILEEMAQSLYREWFVHFRFPGYEKKRLVESELGLIPEGWEVKTLSKFGAVVTGKTPSKLHPEYFDEEYMPFIKIPDMHGNVFCIKTEEGLSEEGVLSQSNKSLPPNSLCISCIGTAGIVSITTTFSQTNQQINSIVLNNNFEREILYFALLDLKETINQYGSNGATMVNLNKGKFEALKVVYPENTVVMKFHRLTHPMFEEIKTFQQKNANLRKTRDLLLPKLISGEMDVEGLDIHVEVGI